MVYILILFFLFTGVPLSFAQGSRKVLDLATSYPSPFGKYKKLDTTFFRYTPIDPPPDCLKGSGYDGYMYLGADGNQYICNEDTPEWEIYTPDLWNKKDAGLVQSIYPDDIAKIDSHFSVGIGTTDPQAKLHIVGESQQIFGPNRYTSIRLQHGSETDPDRSIWELRSYQEFTDLSAEYSRKQIFSIWGDNEAGQNDVLFISKYSNIHLIDTIRTITGSGPNEKYEPKLNVQRQRNAYEEPGKISLDNLAAAFTYNVNAPLGVGIGFGVHIDTQVNNYVQEYGAGIVHERTTLAGDYAGKLHFATRHKNYESNTRRLPVQMTLDEIGNLGLGTTSPPFQLTLLGNTEIANSKKQSRGSGIFAMGALDEDPTLSGSYIDTSLFLWYPKKGSLNAAYYPADATALTDNGIGYYSTAFGAQSYAAGEASSVLGGNSNLINPTGFRSTILGGSGNTIDSQYSLAFGQNIYLTSAAGNTFAWGFAGDKIEIDAKDAFIIATGNVGIGTTNPHKDYALDVKGKIRCKDIDYTGGTITPRKTIGTPNQDIAENFETDQEVEIGDVLVIDEKQKLKLKKSDQPYQKGLIGIVSQDPAIVLEGNKIQIADAIDKFTKGKNPPVALAGQVPCKVTNENGPIETGDLLTSSSVPGHAMRATDRDKAFGTIIGKALEPFTAGPNGESTGKIIVFVGTH